jgi:hypothetical protein
VKRATVARVKQARPPEAITADEKAHLAFSLTVVRAIIAIPLFLASAALLLLGYQHAAMINSAMVFAGTGVAVGMSRSRIAMTVSFLIGIIFLILIIVAFVMFSAALGSK